jgi:hypothetical protein
MVPSSTTPRRGIATRLYTCKWVDFGSTKTILRMLYSPSNDIMASSEGVAQCGTHQREEHPTLGTPEKHRDAIA